MTTQDWILGIGLFLVVMLGVAFLSWLLTSTLADYFSVKRRRQFEEDLVLAIKASQPPLESILGIARTRHLEAGIVYWVLQRLLREVLTGRNADLLPHRSLIEEYIAKLDEIEPFEGMPSEIRIHLERLREHSPTVGSLLEPLIVQIRELLSVNEKDRRQQRYYTAGGFFIGIIGLLIAALSYFYPNTSSLESSSPPPSETAVPK